jgi:hypothetical protein
MITMLVALLMQVAGHKKCEIIQPTPNLMHGLVAAPVLEFTSGWIRGDYGWGMNYTGLDFDGGEIVEEVVKRKKGLEGLINVNE